MPPRKYIYSLLSFCCSLSIILSIGSIYYNRNNMTEYINIIMDYFNKLKNNTQIDSTQQSQSQPQSTQQSQPQSQPQSTQQPQPQSQPTQNSPPKQAPSPIITQIELQPIQTQSQVIPETTKQTDTNSLSESEKGELFNKIVLGQPLPQPDNYNYVFVNPKRVNEWDCKLGRFDNFPKYIWATNKFWENAVKETIKMGCKVYNPNKTETNCDIYVSVYNIVKLYINKTQVAEYNGGCNQGKITIPAGKFDILAVCTHNVDGPAGFAMLITKPGNRYGYVKDWYDSYFVDIPTNERWYWEY